MRYKISNFDEEKNYNDDDVFVLDDKGIKYDPEKDEIVRPGDPRYDFLPEIVY